MRETRACMVVYNVGEEYVPLLAHGSELRAQTIDGTSSVEWVVLRLA